MDFDRLDPDALAAAARAWLVRAARDPRHPWRGFTLATAGADGPDARTVILRAAVSGPAGERLTVYTDSRAAKVAQLRAQPQAAVVMWDPRHRVQLRGRGVVALREGDALSAAEQAAGEGRDYGAAPPPGTPIAAWDAWTPGPGALVAVEVTVSTWDLLVLRREAHRRLRFDVVGATWVVP
jgi:pyridoxamine 5'-phosphate oxidase